jgi:regulator of RNase E activity RraA
LERLASVTSATVSMQLIRRGIRRMWLNGPKPLDARRARLVGPAFTLRFVPMREDLSTYESYSRPGSLREGIEAMPAGAVAVIDARGETRSGTLGDILVARLKERGLLGVVSDGAMRDGVDTAAVGLPVFCNGLASPPSIADHHFAGWGDVIACGGATVVPGDVIVGDEDGCVVVPRALADEVAEGAVEQDRYERFVQIRVKQGAPVLGMYPATEASLADYRTWVEAGEPEA